MSALDDIAWYNTLLQTEGKTCNFVVFDELIEADSEEGGAEMSERREFVKVERMGDKARYSVEIPITTETIHDRMDELEQRISDVNDAALYDRSQLEERIDALEQRIEKLENDQMLTMQTSPKKMPLPVAISYLEGMAHVAQRRVRELDALEQRIEVLERKLNHKGVEQ